MKPVRAQVTYTVLQLRYTNNPNRTGSERLVWGQGSPSTLRAVTTTIKGVRLTMASAICWENMMPLLRYSLYSQNVNLWLAPTADARDTWLPLMRTIGSEGRAYVLSAISCVKRKNLPEWITGNASAAVSSTVTPRVPGSGRRRSTVTVREDNHELVLPSVDENRDSSSAIATTADSDALQKSTIHVNGSLDPSGEEYVCRGGSCIVGPFGQVLQQPLWEVEEGGLLIQEANFEDCERGRLDLDVAGSYSRNDAFKLTVEGLDINPPP